MESVKLYRSLVREINRSSPLSRRERGRPLLLDHVRHLVEADVASEEKTVRQAKHATLLNMTIFLRAQRRHKALLELYNPNKDISQEERVRLSARRVGLNLPIEAVKSDESEAGSQGAQSGNVDDWKAEDKKRS